MEIVKNSVWSTISVGLRGLFSFFINKVISFYFGPSGITFLSHFQNLSSIFILLPNDGVNKGIIKYLSDPRLEERNKHILVSTGLGLSLGLFLITVFLFLFFKEFFPNPFPDTDRNWLFTALLLFGLQVINYYFLSILLSQKRLPTYVMIHVGGNFLSLLLVILFSFRSQYDIALLGWAAGPASAFLISLFFIWKLGLLRILGEKISLRIKAIKNLGEYILVALSILVFSKITDFAIREFAILEYNPEQTGFWQAVVRISDFYLMAFLAYLNMVYYPKASELSNMKNQGGNFTRKFFLGSAPVLALGLLLIYLLREQVLILFFNRDFLPAEGYFGFQLLGDLMKMHSWVLSFLLLAHARVRLFIASQGIFAGIYLASVYYFTLESGILGLPVAHFVRYLLYWLFMVFVYRKLLSGQN